MSTLKIVGILVAIKATIDRNVNSHEWQDFGSSTPIVDGKHSVFQVFGSSESYGRQKCQLPLLTGFWFLWKQRLQSEEGGGPIGKRNRKCGGPTFLSVWRTYMWGGKMWFTVWRTHKWWKCKQRIAPKATVMWQLIENKSFKCTPIFHSA